MSSRKFKKTKLPAPEKPKEKLLEINYLEIARGFAQKIRQKIIKLKGRNL